jgi:Dolichyl-phosphate-mannose-protein mannosyltransferase
MDSERTLSRSDLSRHDAKDQPGAINGLSTRASIVLYALAFFTLAWPWISGAVTIPWDAKAQSQPSLQFLARSLANGESPLWTPNVFLGWPQIADPQSLLFSPLHVVLAWINPNLGFRETDAATFAALFFGGLGVILFFHDRGWRSAGALVASLAFAFGGVAASRLQHTNEIFSLAYFPLGLWLLCRALNGSSWRDGAAAGLVIGLMAADRDQVAMLSLYVICSLVIVHHVGDVRRLRASAKPLLGFLVAASIVAIGPVLLTALLAAASNRPAIVYDMAGTGSLHPALLLTLAVPDLFAASTTSYWGPPSGAWEHTGLIFAQNMGQLYDGALPLVALIGLGLIHGKLWSREIRFFSVSLSVVMLYALGWYTPAFHLIFDAIPGVALWRRPADAAFLIGALVSIVGGYLVHRCLTDPIIRMTARHILTAALVSAAILICAILVSIFHSKFEQAILPLCIGVIAPALATGILVLARRLRRYPLVPAVFLTSFMTVDLVWNNGPSPSTGVAASVYDAMQADTSNDTIRLLKTRLAASAAPDRRDRVELIGLGYHWPNIGLIHDFDHVFGQNPLRLKEFSEATGVGDTVAAADQRPFSALYPSYRSTFADLLGVRYIATGVPIESIDRSLKPGDLVFIARTNEGYVYENPRALPRVMVVPNWQLAEFGSVVQNGWPSVDPRRTVLLERPPANVSDTSPRDPDGVAKIVSYGHTRVIVDVTAPTGGFLVLNDIWHPWWRAHVDATDVPILKANVLLRAVQLSPGHHVVEFEFDVLAGVMQQIMHRL